MIDTLIAVGLCCFLTVYTCFQGLDDEYQEEGKLLGSYTYQDDEDALQTYPVTVSTLQHYLKGLDWPVEDVMLVVHMALISSTIRDGDLESFRS